MYKFRLLLFAFFIISCNEKKVGHSDVKKINLSSIESKNLISINFNDSQYSDLNSHCKDTITLGGWKIQYLVKNDKTKYTDLYIKCSKNNCESIYCAENVLEFRRYFIPSYEFENNTNLFFTHGCATDCSAILVFSKNASTFHDYTNVVKYNFELGQILCVTENCYEHEDDIYELELNDILRKKTHKLQYKEICTSVFKPSCVDTVIFSADKTIIKTTLLENTKRDKEVVQTRVINLK